MVGRSGHGATSVAWAPVPAACRYTPWRSRRGEARTRVSALLAWACLAALAVACAPTTDTANDTATDTANDTANDTATDTANDTASTGTAGPDTAGDTASTADPGAVAPATVDPAAIVAGRPWPVSTTTEILTDPTRTTPEGNQTPEATGRRLELTLHRPEGTGPFPLVVFSHGLAGHPEKFSMLLTAWARAGYVVAAPAFPLTNESVPGARDNWFDVADQPGDVSFVLDHLLESATDPAGDWAGVIDPDRIGVAGLSLGGATTYALGFNPCCRDERADAAMVLSGALFPMGGPYELDGHIPLLVVHGTDDLAFAHQTAVDAVAEASDPVWFITLEGGTHAEPFEDAPSPHDTITEAATMHWWDLVLLGDQDAATRLLTDATVAGLSRVDRNPA